jgi:hypothetical protein
VGRFLLLMTPHSVRRPVPQLEMQNATPGIERRRICPTRPAVFSWWMSPLRVNAIRRDRRPIRTMFV